MKDNDLLMIVLAFFLGFCFRKMMRGRLIEGKEINMTGKKEAIILNNCTATGLVSGGILENVDSYSNECDSETYEECLNKKGQEYVLNGHYYGCTPNADSYVRQNSDETCPSGYENTIDTGFTLKPRYPTGCVDSCKDNTWGWCWGDKVCTTKGTETNESSIKLCKKENVFNVKYD